MFIRSHFSGGEVESRCPNGKRPEQHRGRVSCTPLDGGRKGCGLHQRKQSILRSDCTRSAICPEDAVAALILEHIQPRQFGSSETHL